MREFIYKNVKPHDTDITLPKNFSPIDTQQINYKIQPDQEQRMALLHMTPFAWRATSEMQAMIKQADALEIEVDFVLTLARKDD